MDRYKKDAQCPKCGEVGASSLYLPERQMPAIYGGQAYLSETIERICMNCQHTWYESPLDTKENEK